MFTSLSIWPWLHRSYFHWFVNLTSHAPFLSGPQVDLMMRSEPSNIFNTPCRLDKFALFNSTSFTPPIIHNSTNETNILFKVHKCQNNQNGAKNWSLSKKIMAVGKA
jgi:hypothetical protein